MATSKTWTRTLDPDSVSRRSNDWIFASKLFKKQTIKIIKLNKVALKQAEAAVRNIHRKTPVLESLFDKVIFHTQVEKKTHFITMKLLLQVKA